MVATVVALFCVDILSPPTEKPSCIKAADQGRALFRAQRVFPSCGYVFHLVVKFYDANVI